MFQNLVIKNLRSHDCIPFFGARTLSEYRGFCSDCFEFFDEYDAFTCTCGVCGKLILFVDGKLAWPELPSIPPTEHMPDNVRIAYVEAQAVIGRSPQCACAMLRLALERLCVQLGGEGNSLRAKILSLNLSPDMEKLCDACRIVGNDAVHEGMLFVKDTDTDELAMTLSRFVNWITDRTIAAQVVAESILKTDKKKKRKD